MYETLSNNTSVTHEDIVTIYNNPYLSTISNWSNIPTQEQNIIKNEYPGTDDLAKAISTAKKDFVNALEHTSPDIRNFVNNFAIPVTITSQQSNNNSLLSKAAKKVINVLASGAEEINKLFIPGYGAYREGGTPLEVITSATCDLAITLCGGKVIKIGWQGAKSLGNKIGAKIASTLQPTRQVVGVGNVRAVPQINNNFYKVYNNNVNASNVNASTRVANNININNNVNNKQITLNLDAQNKTPYNARAMEELLKTQNPNAKVTSSTLPRPNQRNVKLAGQRHKTGIVFDSKGFPILDDYAKVEVRITGDLANMKSEAHMRMATEQLRTLISEGKVCKNIFTSGQLNDIENLEPRISGLTWHHHQDVGRMQLVPRELHRKIAHIGGNSIWGSGK